MEELTPRLVRKLKRVRLVVSDLDGTLLNDEGKITDVTRKSVWKLKGLGIKFAIMTARAHSSAERIADELDVTMPIISLDGGLIRLPHSKENIFASYIKSSVVRKIISEAERKFASVVLFVDDKMVCHETETMVPSYIDSFKLDRVEIENLNSVADKTIQIIVGADSKHNIASIARRSIHLFSKTDTKVYKSSRYDDRWYLEIKNKDHSKATGLSHLEKYLRIGKKEVAVVGDFQNDIAAFERAGIGVAMKNAVWELKERADLITHATNDQNGAAEFFETIFKLRMDHGS
ncbi:MAG TPA: HAD family hydrolase [Candidatus Acidoferrales bacterium]|nr:HAD family hydrolase [Candidatus Acidoferrales bacterium]